MFNFLYFTTIEEIKMHTSERGRELLDDIVLEIISGIGNHKIKGIEKRIIRLGQTIGMFRGDTETLYVKVPDKSEPNKSKIFQYKFSQPQEEGKLIYEGTIKEWYGDSSGIVIAKGNEDYIELEFLGARKTGKPKFNSHIHELAAGNGLGAILVEEFSRLEWGELRKMSRFYSVLPNGEGLKELEILAELPSDDVQKVVGDHKGMCVVLKGKDLSGKFWGVVEYKRGNRRGNVYFGELIFREYIDNNNGKRIDSIRISGGIERGLAIFISYKTQCDGEGEKQYLDVLLWDNKKEELEHFVTIPWDRVDDFKNVIYVSGDGTGIVLGINSRNGLRFISYSKRKPNKRK